MSDILSGLSLLEKRNRLREYDLRVLLDDSDEMRGSTWSRAQDLLLCLAKEATFQLGFVNQPDTVLIEGPADVANAMDSINPTGTREILKKLENVVLDELEELWDMSTVDLPRRKKLGIIVILYDLPTDLPPRDLKASVDFAVKNLTRAQLPTERISIRFVQVGFSRELRRALETLDDDLPRRRSDANIADFTLFMGSMDDTKLWKILLGKVLSSLDQLGNNSRLTLRPRAIPSTGLPSPTTRFGVSPSSPVLHYPAYLQDGGLQTTRTYDLSNSFTVTGWIIQKESPNTPAHDFFIFHCGRSPLFRASVGAARGDCIGIWLPNASDYLSARGLPDNLWTFICVVYDGCEVRFGLNGFLSSKTSLSPVNGLDNVKIGVYASKSSPNISLANIKVYNRVREQDEILSEYSTSLPNL